MNSHDGMKAIVTGAADGIGRAVTHRLLSEGAMVLAVDFNAQRLSQLSAPGSEESRLFRLQQDVNAPTAAQTIVEAANEQMKGVDFLVNNAGVVAGPGNEVENHDESEWDRVLDTNLKAVFKLCRESIPVLRRSNRGRIVNIGSIMSTFGGAGMAAYAASKHGVAGLSKSLALELGPAGITVNYIQPGAIVTGITRPAMDSNKDFEAYWSNRSAIKRMGQPEDIASGISFLLSEDAGFITGHGLVIDGGILQSA